MFLKPITIKRLLILLLFPISSLVIAQQTEGKIIYTRTTTFKMDLEAFHGMKKHIDKMPKSRTQQHQLIFNGSSSLFENYVDIDVEDSIANSGGTFFGRRGFKRPEEQRYRDITNGTTTESREFMDKKFLIKGNDKPVWKIKPEQAKIKNYLCQRAEWKKDSVTNVIAWFTFQIPISSGPDEYYGLPGMILKVDINEGTMILEADQINFGKIDKSELIEPNKGKEVTQEEFMAILKEKMEEMKEMGSGLPWGNIRSEKR